MAEAGLKDQSLADREGLYGGLSELDGWVYEPVMMEGLQRALDDSAENSVEHGEQTGKEGRPSALSAA